MNEPILRAPFLRAENNVRSRMRDVLIALTPSLIAAWYFYGAHVLLMAACGVAACAACETLFSLALRQPLRLWDCSFAVTGLLCALLLPAEAPFWVPAVAGAAAMLCKSLFGGIGRNWINPALLGAMLCYVTGLAPLDGPFYILLRGQIAAQPLLQLIGSPAGGAIGACSPLLLALGYCYLAARNLARPAFSLSFLLVLLAGSSLFLTGSVLHIFCMGEALLLILFCGSDSVTTPMLLRSQLILGILGGAAAVGLRLLGIEGAAVALLLCGPASRGLDALFLRNRSI